MPDGTPKGATDRYPGSAVEGQVDRSWFVALSQFDPIDQRRVMRLGQRRKSAAIVHPQHAALIPADQLPDLVNPGARVVLPASPHRRIGRLPTAAAYRPSRQDSMRGMPEMRPAV